MNGRRPLVSIIVPSFNQGAFIGETLESVLSQDYRPLDVVVVDGASTDETLDVLGRFEGTPELRWSSEPDRGVVEAVNKGLSMARGRFAAIQSSDDTYLPGAVARAVAELAHDPDLAFVYGDIVKVDEAGAELAREVLPPFTLEGFLAKATWVPQPATFFRLDLARELGGWREEVAYAADTDLWLRMALRFPAKKIDGFLARRRSHPGQRAHQRNRIVRDYERMLSTIPEVGGLPTPLRRAAEAGRLLHRNRFGTDEDRSVQEARIREALLLYPPLYRIFGFGPLVPGWSAAMTGFGRLRRLLLRDR